MMKRSWVGVLAGLLIGFALGAAVMMFGGQRLDRRAGADSAVAGPAAVARTDAGHSAHGAAGAKTTSTPPAPPGTPSAGYQAANDRMHAAMSVAMTGDPDVDFVRAMIPHHEGAVEMAKIALAGARDPSVKQLAQTMVTTQEAEIARMRDWLAQRGK